MLLCVVLLIGVLCCVVLRCDALCCFVLCCDALCYVALCCFVLLCDVFGCDALCCFALCCFVLCCVLVCCPSTSPGPVETWSRDRPGNHCSVICGSDRRGGGQLGGRQVVMAANRSHVA